MYNLFISQPMRGKTDDEIHELEAKIVAEVQAQHPDEHVVRNNFFDDFDGTPVAFLGKSISAMAFADGLYFGEGWQEARGCKIEHDVAVAYGLNIIHD